MLTMRFMIDSGAERQRADLYESLCVWHMFRRSLVAGGAAFDLETSACHAAAVHANICSIGP
jgi:hypothetical protein